MSSFEFDSGFHLSADTYLSDTINPFNERRLAWFHDYYNRILVRYELDIELLTCICIVNEQWVLFDEIDVSMSEWNGTDCKWHSLGIRIEDQQLSVFRDEEIVFQHTDSIISQMPKTGFVEISNRSSRTCFDNVVLVSIEGDQSLCGDSDGSGTVDIDDAVHLIDYIFAGGTPPDPIESGDVDCSGGVDIDDIAYLAEYIFSGGAQPCEGCL